MAGNKRFTNVYTYKSKSAQLCPTLSDPMDCSLPGSSVHGILQARTLEWISSSFFKESSKPMDQTWVSCIIVRFFTIWATRETNMVCVSVCVCVCVCVCV